MVRGGSKDTAAYGGKAHLLARKEVVHLTRRLNRREVKLNGEILDARTALFTYRAAGALFLSLKSELAALAGPQAAS